MLFLLRGLPSLQSAEGFARRDFMKVKECPCFLAPPRPVFDCPGRPCFCTRICCVGNVLFKNFPDLPRSISAGLPAIILRGMSGNLLKINLRRNIFDCKHMVPPRLPRRIRHRMNSIAHVKRSGDFSECLAFGASGDVFQACCFAAICRL